MPGGWLGYGECVRTLLSLRGGKILNSRLAAGKGVEKQQQGPCWEQGELGVTWWEVMPYPTHPWLGIGGTSPGEGDILAITHSWGWVNKWGAEFLDHPLYQSPRWEGGGTTPRSLLGSWVTSPGSGFRRWAPSLESEEQ